MEDKYRRLTAAQVELWLENPVTKYHLLNLENQIKDIEDEVNAGAGIDPLNNDLTCWNLANQQGRKVAYTVASDPVSLLNSYQMIEIEEAKDPPQETFVAPDLKTV